jgi:hypothetical protein
MTPASPTTVKTSYSSVIKTSPQALVFLRLHSRYFAHNTTRIANQRYSVKKRAFFALCVYYVCICVPVCPLGPRVAVASCFSDNVLPNLLNPTNSPMFKGERQPFLYPLKHSRDIDIQILGTISSANTVLQLLERGTGGCGSKEPVPLPHRGPTGLFRPSYVPHCLAVPSIICTGRMYPKAPPTVDRQHNPLARSPIRNITSPLCWLCATPEGVNQC